MSNLDLVVWLLWWVHLLSLPFNFPLWMHPLKPSSPHPPALWPSQVTLTWLSGYIGGCICCLTLHCGCSLCNSSYKDTPLVRLFSPSHFCFQFSSQTDLLSAYHPSWGWLDPCWLLSGVVCYVVVHILLFPFPFLGFQRFPSPPSSY